MVDNFNLRSFLTENKLTKNAKLLNEGGDKPKVSTLGWKELESSTDPEIKKLLASYEAGAAADYDEMDRDQGMMQQYMHTSDPRSDKTIKMLQQLIALAGEKGVELHPEAPPAKPEEEAKVLGFWDKVKSKVGLKEEEDLDQETTQGTDISGYWVMYGGLNKGVPMLIKMFPSEEEAQQALQDAPTTYGQHVLRGNWGIQSAQDWLASGKELGPDSMGHPDRVPRKPLSPEELAAIRQLDFDAEMEREGTQNKKPIMKETNLTAKERRLVEMVNSAMGIGEEEGHQNADPNVPNDSTDMAIDMMKNGLPEGEEMVQDKPLPKYESIEELMKEIEHGTNEAAHKYKMEEMKRVYEALEAKVGSLEEGEHAEHIDQKAVKQMRKDIAALRKAEEKLRKEFEKKFAGKEKKETPAKEKAVETLQEGFDLRKFLAENKLTAGSRMVSEAEAKDSAIPTNEFFNSIRKVFARKDDELANTIYDTLLNIAKSGKFTPSPQENNEDIIRYKIMLSPSESKLSGAKITSTDLLIFLDGNKLDCSNGIVKKMHELFKKYRVRSSDKYRQ